MRMDLEMVADEMNGLQNLHALTSSVFYSRTAVKTPL